MKIIITKGTDRVVRGGSWYFAFVIRMAYSHSYNPDCRHNDGGLRITRRIK